MQSFVMVTVLPNSIQYILPYIKVSNVGRLNYVYLHKHTTFISIKINNVHNMPYKNPVQSFPETCVVSTRVCGSKHLPGCVVQILLG